MAGFYKGKEIANVYHKNRVINAIYKGAVLVWEAVRSCFDKGFWVNEQPWDNEDGWKNNS